MIPHQDGQLVVQGALMALWQRPARTPVICSIQCGGPLRG